jgi:hypothetical protein
MAFKRSFELGYGTETDIRDLDGTIVISHDMPTSSSSPMTLDAFLALYNAYEAKTLALNVKADGLQEIVRSLLYKYKIENYVLFDMSVPDMIRTADQGLKFVTRLSEYETDLPFSSQSSGVWVDEFSEEWVSSDILLQLSSTQKRVFIVSPELHKREHIPRWRSMKSAGIHLRANLVLCTDYPEEANSFYYD